MTEQELIDAVEALGAKDVWIISRPFDGERQRVGLAYRKDDVPIRQAVAWKDGGDPPLGALLCMVESEFEKSRHEQH